MVDSNRIPIKKKATGQVEWGESAKVQTERKRHFAPPTNQPNLPPASEESNRENLGGWKGDDRGARHQSLANSPKGGNPPTKSQKNRSEIEDLEQFITYAYSRSGQRIALKRSVEKALCRNPKLSPEARERLLQKADEDLLLAVPRQLLLTFRDIVGYPSLRNEVRNFVHDVLARHPAFSIPELAATLNGVPDAPRPNRALTILVKTDFATLPVVAGHKKPLRRKDFDQMRTNAANCLAVWLSETRGISLEQLNQYLFLSLWEPQVKTIKDETGRLRFLTEIRDLAGVGLACSVFKQQADEQIRVAMSAKEDREAALEQATALQAFADQLRNELLGRDQRISDLSRVVETEKQNNADTRAHLRDDYEQLRTRLLRRLKDGAELLSEGLHALRRDNPKIRVMEDHAERTLDALKKEIQYLESRN